MSLQCYPDSVYVRQGLGLGITVLLDETKGPRPHNVT